MRKYTLLLLAGAAIMAAPALAQSNQSTQDRLGKIEKEVTALQRKVFGGTGAYVEPEINRTPGTAPVPGSPASTPLTDVTARMDAVEMQLAALTGQIEQAGFRQRQFEEQFARYKADTEAKIAALTAPPPAIAAEVEPAPAIVPAAAPPRAAATPRPSASPTPAASSRPATAKPTPAIATAADNARKEAIAAIERPTGGDPATDAYNYGYRLWSAKFYPEAIDQLKATVDKYPTSSMASRTQNLLGRAYLDDNRPNLAALAFRDSYEKWPKGDRAADSLAYLGEALIQLKKPQDACKIYQVLEEGFNPLNATLKGMMEKGRARARCAA